MPLQTGKPTVFSEQILEHFGLRQYIDVVSGIPLDREPPDKCEVILHALYEMGISDRSGCVMVGDRSHDAIGAKWRGSISSACFTATAAAKSWKPKEPTPSQTALQRCEVSCFHKIIQHPACPTVSTVRQAGCVFIGGRFYSMVTSAFGNQLMASFDCALCRKPVAKEDDKRILLPGRSIFKFPELDHGADAVNHKPSLRRTCKAL